MARLDRGLTFEGLDAGGVVEDQTELAPVGLELLGGQLDARQARHMSDIDVDGHGAIVLPGPDRPSPKYVGASSTGRWPGPGTPSRGRRHGPTPRACGRGWSPPARS